MPQQHLQRAQVGAVIEQMGGKTVPQTMRADRVRIDAGNRRIAFDQAPELLAAQWPARGVDEQGTCPSTAGTALRSDSVGRAVSR